MGSRSRYQPRKAKFDETRRRWVRTDSVQIIHYVRPDGTDEEGEGSIEGWGETHILFFAPVGPGNQKMTINLSEMTGEEVQAIRDTLDTILAQAQQVCELRDIKAREAFDAGDDSFHRVYRQVPVVVDREGTQRRDGARLPERPQGVPDGDGSAPAQELRDERRGLPDAPPQDDGSQDDEA